LRQASQPANQNPEIDRVNDQMNSLRKENYRASEEGYVLVALLALMAILAMMMIAAAPRLRQQSQREIEKEAIYRGDEVADAILLYVRTYNRLPTSIEDLSEGLPRGSKKVQILRHSATVDPLSSSGEWKLIRVNDPKMIEFQRRVMLYANGRLPNTQNQLLSNAVIQIAGLRNTGSDEDAPGGEDNSANVSGPFIGVISRSQRNSVLTFYGIDRHDLWIFTPLFRG
jgi:type II secretory pathway pseudopilin PulG